MNPHIISLAALILISASPFGSAQSNAPAAKPAPPPLTPEQKAAVDAARSATPDKPFPKLDLQPLNKDGSVNTNFGKLNPSFRGMHETFLKRKAQPIGVLFIGDSI